MNKATAVFKLRYRDCSRVSGWAGFFSIGIDPQKVILRLTNRGMQKMFFQACLILMGLLLNPLVVLGEGGFASRELTISTSTVDFTGKPVEALTVDGGIPGPTLHFTEGDIARIDVHNKLDVWTYTR